MNTRQKKGVTLGIGGVLAIIAGIVIGTTAVTPEWLDLVLSIVGTVGAALGFAIVLPNTEG